MLTSSPSRNSRWHSTSTASRTNINRHEHPVSACAFLLPLSLMSFGAVLLFCIVFRFPRPERFFPHLNWASKLVSAASTVGRTTAYDLTAVVARKGNATQLGGPT